VIGALVGAEQTNRIQGIWNAKTNVVPVITGNWNHLKITQKIPEQHTRKA
jgi:hypothetical protein